MKKIKYNLEKIRYKLVACSKCFTVKLVLANTFGTHIYCPVCKMSVRAIETDIETDGLTRIMEYCLDEESKEIIIGDGLAWAECPKCKHIFIAAPKHVKEKEKCPMCGTNLERHFPKQREKR